MGLSRLFESLPALLKRTQLDCYQWCAWRLGRSGRNEDVAVCGHDHVDDTDVINFLLSTEIIPLCLRTMEMGSELSKTVATFIVQKILLDEVGLNYICATAERFFAVGAVLGSMVQMLTEQPSVRLLKHIIRCYLRLSDNPRAREALRQCLPEQLRDPNFTACLKDDVTTRRWLAQLLMNVGHGGDNNNGLSQPPLPGGH
eukprot:1192551-Prorocentrum_minimum.AAC.5